MVASSILLGGLLVGVTAGPSVAATFPNPAPISIPLIGPATPYPSPISVSNLAGTITDVNVTLTDLTHPAPDDVDVLLVGPSGQNVILMSDVGGDNDVNAVDLTFDDAFALFALPDSGQIVSGSFRPTSHGSFNGSSPAPAGPYGAQLSVFDGTSPNGTWNLFVYDDNGIEGGSISAGWSLDITTNGPSIGSFAPDTGPAGATVVISGTGFTGASSVTFGGVSGTFTVDGPTQITATVPVTAVTGPIAVTTPNGTATSDTNFTVTAGPGIVSFAPLLGQVGDEVVITGVNFTGATAVAFDGVPVTTFSVDSAEQITATVPAGTGTGPISVTGPGGTGTSGEPFVVKHARELSLNVTRKAKGSVGVIDGFTACGVGVPVKVQHREDGRWRTIGKTLTNANRGYSVPGTQDPGTYRAVAKKVTIASGDVCLKDVSPIARKGS